MDHITIFIDGWCSNCQRFASMLRVIDFFHSLSIEDIRNISDLRIDSVSGLIAMASLDSKGNVVYGYETLYKISKILPVLWVLLPISYLLKVSRLGDYLYKELAIRRKIIPMHCDENSCDLNP